MRIAVVVATLGRPDVAGELFGDLQAQTRKPDIVVYVTPAREDAPVLSADAGAEFVLAPKGLCAQRNVGLDAVRGRADAVVFFDDDFVPSRTFLEWTERLFETRADVHGLTGEVLSDGINNAGVSREDAVRIVAEHDARLPEGEDREGPAPGLYGCNMAYRMSAVEDLRFDERLPLYGWLEDADFSRQVEKRGRLLKSARLTGVHRGVKGGRQSGLRLGYSQIVNPIYLARKGTISWGQALDNVSRNFLKNHARAFFPEPWVDRRGRVSGNWRGVVDVVRGRLQPERILEF